MTNVNPKSAFLTDVKTLSVRPGTNRVFRDGYRFELARLESRVTLWVAPIREVLHVDR